MYNKIDEYIATLDEYKVSLINYNKKVTPVLFSQDEEVFHIESKVAIEVTSDSKVKEFVIFIKERKETIGLELEIELDEFIDFDSYDPGYSEALISAKKYINKY